MFTRWNDLDQMLGAMNLFRSRMNSVFSELDRNYAGDPGWTRDIFPKTNLCDTGDNLEVIAEVPGIAKESLAVKIQGNYLEISGTRQAELPEGYKARRMERGQTSFSRSFTLPYDVDASLVQATLKDGMLTMILPKSEAAKPKQIPIN